MEHSELRTERGRGKPILNSQFRGLLIAAVVIAASVAVAARQTPQPAPAPEVAADPAPSFETWLAEFRSEALAVGISATTVERALSNVEQLPVVVERDRSQAERILPLDKYLAQRLTARTIRTAREMAHRYRGVLARVEARYGVPSQVIVAIWGIESNFGRFTGVRPTVPALATLAFEGRRAMFFRNELLDALRIVDRGHIELDKLKGSWAGAMGQPQFMPSSYLKWAEDFDGDGRRDIWASNDDVFASIASYLKGHGWVTDRRWGRAIKVSPASAASIEKDVPMRTGTCEARRQMTESRPLARWQQLGVRMPNGAALPKVDQVGSIVQAGRQNYLVYENYDAILEYNCAHAYALSVGLLADRIAGS